jgi:hypothetical protein
MAIRNRKPKPAWIRRKNNLTEHLCVHCGKPLQDWEYLRNKFYHAACLLKIKLKFL